MTNREYLLAEMRAASARVKLCGLDLDAIGLALAHNIINEWDAAKMLQDRGLMCFVGEGARIGNGTDGQVVGSGDYGATPTGSAELGEGRGSENTQS